MAGSDKQILDAPSADDFDDDKQDEQEAEQLEMLDKLGMSLSKNRTEAITYRQNSGIEREWMEDREHYEGIDDTNRGELGDWESKPLGQGALQDGEGVGSTVFFNITRPYCDTASARVGDMLLPTDDKGWAIEPTPIPDLIAIADGKIPTKIQQQIEAQVPQDKLAATIKEIIADQQMILDEAKSQADRAEKRINDWHTECQYNAEMRVVIEDCSQIGTGVMKGPIPENKKHLAFFNNQMVMKDELQPISRRVQVQNCYPDPSCGQNIQNGAFHFEKDDISERALHDLRNQEGYYPEQIERCLKEGSHKAVRAAVETPNVDRGDQVGLVRRDKTKLYEIWYVYARLRRTDLEAAGVEIDTEGPEITDIDVYLVMVNNRVIKAANNHLSTGEFPYDYMVWQARAGLPYGIGISRQVRVPQRIINGGGRNLMDNAGMAGGPMWAFNQGILEPVDGVYEIAPRKGWFVSEDATAPEDIAKAFSFIEFPMLQEDLQAIIKLGMSFAEYISGLPSLLQGQEQGNEETLGGQQMRRNDGSTVLRRIARHYDDRITTPHLRRYYDYLLMYGNDDEKGDFVVKARGSSALVERDIQNESIAQLGSLVTNPIYGKDPKKWMNEYMKSQRLDPKNFDYEDDEWKQLVEQMSAPPADSSVQVAQLKIDFETFKLQSNQQLEAGKIANENEQKERDRELEVLLTSSKEQLALVVAEMEHLGTKDVNLDNIKAHLTEVIITLEAQMQLSGDDGKGPEVAKPALEPEGRAADDKSFQE